MALHHPPAVANGDVYVPRSVTVSADGRWVYAAGWGTTPLGRDFITLAYDAVTGEEAWTARYDGPDGKEDTLVDLAVAPDGATVFVTGLSAAASRGDFDYATVAYDAGTGAERWVARYDAGTNDGDFPSALAVSPDGGHLYVTGRSTSDAGVDAFATVAYTVATGQQVWAAGYQPIGSFGSRAAGLAVAPGGERVYVTGTSDEANGTAHTTVAIDAVDGAQAWAQSYRVSFGNAVSAGAVTVAPDGEEIYVAGSSANPLGGEDAATIAYDAVDGRHQWVARYNSDAPRGADTMFVRDIGVSVDGRRVFALANFVYNGGPTRAINREDLGVLAYDVPTGIAPPSSVLGAGDPS